MSTESHYQQTPAMAIASRVCEDIERLPMPDRVRAIDAIKSQIPHLLPKSVTIELTPCRGCGARPALYQPENQCVCEDRSCAHHGKFRTVQDWNRFNARA